MILKLTFEKSEQVHRPGNGSSIFNQQSNSEAITAFNMNIEFGNYN